jgi:hypothetical protein
MTPLAHRAYFALPEQVHCIDGPDLFTDDTPRATVVDSLPALAAWIDAELANHNPNGSNDR